MHTESNFQAPLSSSPEVDAALHALSTPTQAENLSQVAELSEGIDAHQVAEHIRGVVAATMRHLSTTASAGTRTDAAQWQDWALRLADGLTREAPPKA